MLRLMDDLVWVGDRHDEPDWARGGSYVVVRMIRMLVERWDRTPLGEQQTIMGREKASGAPLGMAQERDLPHYLAPDNKIPDGRPHPPRQPADRRHADEPDPAPPL